MHKPFEQPQISESNQGKGERGAGSRGFGGHLHRLDCNCSHSVQSMRNYAEIGSGRPRYPGDSPPNGGILIERKQKGGFVKGWFWRMYPRSGFWYRGTSACTFVPVLVPGNIRMYPRSGFWYRGTSAKATLLETTLLRTPELTTKFLYVFFVYRFLLLPREVRPCAI